MRSLSLVALVMFSTPALAGIAVLKNGEVVVGQLDATGEDLTFRWPHGAHTSRGMLVLSKQRVRWFDPKLDAPSGDYWERFADAPIDERWLGHLEAWRREQGEDDPARSSLRGLTPVWVGVYTDGELRLSLRRRPYGIGGTLEIGGDVYLLSGELGPKSKVIKGLFVKGEERFAYTVAFVDSRRVVLTSAGAVHELGRAPSLVPRSASGPQPTRPQAQAAGSAKPGQRYRFQFGGAARFTMTWEIVEVSQREVRYLMHTEMNGKPVGEPSEQTFPLSSSAHEGMPVEQVQAGGRSWSCWRVENGEFVVWVPQQNGKPIFPPVIRQKRGDEVLLELKAVEEPPQ